MEDKLVVLENISKDGKPLKAIFMPLKGMNLVSYQKNQLEVIDQTTIDLFKERYAGLGAMIGPHFYHRDEMLIKEVPNEDKYPHIQKVKAKGAKEPFSHGIGRYAPWKYKASTTKIEANLKGSDQWYGNALKDLEGFDFEMSYTAEITPNGLEIFLKASADVPCVIGLHTYYQIDKKSTITTQVKRECLDKNNTIKVPDRWFNPEKTHLRLKMNEEVDIGFTPVNLSSGRALLETGTHNALISYKSSMEQMTLQVYHPKEASFACIEPIGAKNPRNLTEKNSSIHISIEILP